EALSEETEKPDLYLRTGEVATMLHVSTKTVARWADEGKINYVLTLGGHRRYSVRGIRRVMAEVERRDASRRPSRTDTRA
ncbi:MAG: helix-turn-helix domain-containing protein, partial [Candidatus Dormibacteria bacterium]